MPFRVSWKQIFPAPVWNGLHLWRHASRRSWWVTCDFLIETAHLVVGLGALTFIGRISASFMHRKTAAVAASAIGDAARQAQSVR